MGGGLGKERARDGGIQPCREGQVYVNSPAHELSLLTVN